ncbi:KAP family P-loop NTPase fold protein [Bacillus cereus group sp. MYBK106-1]|uniref:KAP family P-loop NTPase fold protein n=1 Tax=unclassified Bacillus cereus group TaxID=2750818 RepID=UPI003F7A41E6
MLEKLHYLPLEDVDKDRLGFKEKAEEIATFINDFSPNLPYCISINGSWGAGKSTMLNFLEGSLDKGKCITVRFNPWMVSESEELTKSLFEEIYYAMGEGNFQKTKETFFKYAEKIVPSLAKAAAYTASCLSGATPVEATAMSNSTGEAVKGIGDLVFDKPLSKRKDELNKAMDVTVREDKRKIVIMIDELDRLFPEEVITIFQMIKSNLDLPGLFFVVAMDEEVVFDALKEKGISKPEYYLQKIFQRKYLINTKYQLMTLTDNFILKLLDVENNEAHRVLNEILLAYFYGNEACFAITSQKKASEYHNDFEDGWTIKSSDSSYIIDSYRDVIESLRIDINLHNPRTFLSFSRLLLEQWSNYYRYVFSKEKNIACFIHVSFLIFVVHFIYPSFIDTKYIGVEKNQRIDESIPIFIRNINKHINILMPDIEEQTEVYHRTYFPGSSIIRTSIIALTKFPDYTRER